MQSLGMDEGVPIESRLITRQIERAQKQVEGRNFEGPAPRPMDRTSVELDAEGQILVDTSRLYACAPGTPCQFETDPNSYLVVS